MQLTVEEQKEWLRIAENVRAVVEHLDVCWLCQRVSEIADEQELVGPFTGEISYKYKCAQCSARMRGIHERQRRGLAQAE